MPKNVRKKIRLNSTGLNAKGKKTGYFKTTNKSLKDTDKVRKKCFDPRAFNPKTGRTGMHVLFEEGKI
jgi:hypothetical protein